MATIEPRLIHLLNDPTTPELPSSDLLPSTDLLPLPSLLSLQLPPLPGTRDGPLPPLQLEGLRADRFFGSAGRNATLPSLNGGGGSGAPLASPFVGEQSTFFSDHRRDSDFCKEGKYAGSSALYPLRLLLSEVNLPLVPTPAAPSFSSILNEGPDFQDDAHSYSSSAPAPAPAQASSTAASITAITTAPTTDTTTITTSPTATRKRPAIHIKDDFVQLPQPAKKPKAHQAPFMPPIINGLLEPPPHVALFPPIESSAFDDTDAGQSKLLHELSYSPPGPRVSPEPDQPVAKPRATRKRASKPRRKWSEEETNHLLMGVDRHGVGKWTNILDDPDFFFNSRSAGDLKDRFRTCCPEEMRVTDNDHRQSRARRRLLRSQTPSPKKSDKMSPDSSVADGGTVDGTVDETLSGKEPAAACTPLESDDLPAKRSRAHRMKVSDLAGLGITGPFRRAHRRERTAFTNRDDSEILQGLEAYGPAWSKIQRDKRFHLSSRHPTDLRDRVRNKYPYIYQRIEKGVFQPKDVSTTNILEPMVSTTIDHSFKTVTAPPPPLTSKAINRGGLQEEPPRWLFLAAGSAEHSQQPSRDSDESSASLTSGGGEMDISRLLLDDSRVTALIS